MTITDAEFEAAFKDLHAPLLAMNALAEEVANKTGITLAQMRGPSRTRFVVRARHLFMFKANQAGVSYTNIGNYLNRDHTTVWHGIKQVKRSIEKHEMEVAA